MVLNLKEMSQEKEISQEVEQVLAKRKPTYEKCSEIGKMLKNLKEDLQDFKSLTNLLSNKQDIESKSNKIYILVQELIATTDKLKIRFSRETLNIGVIGMARQGKSTLLQSLTGLTNNEIPSGNLDNCTGSMSIIEHLNVDETYGEILFYTKDEFLNDVLKPYYNSLSLGNLLNLTDFQIHPLPELPTKLQNDIEKVAEYSHLRKLKENFSYYNHLLSHDKKQIKRDEIRSYIAQDDTDGNRSFYNYLAVKEAKIYCKYPKIDISKVALCDTPGLGQTGVGHEEGIINIISKELDYILFIKLPPNNGAIWAKQTDIKLHNLVSNGVKTIPINDWSMYIMNKTSSNQAQSEHLKNTMSEIGISAKCVVADCSDPKEAREKILIPVLEYLSSNILRIDNIYLNSYFKDLNYLSQELISLIKESETILEKEIGSTNIEDNFDKLFKDFFENDLKQKLSDLVKEMRIDLSKYEPSFIKNGNDTNKKLLTLDDEHSKNSFANDIEVLISNCEQNPQIPTLESIKLLNKGGDSLNSAYDNSMHIMRANLSNRFFNLEDNLEKYIENMKIKVGEKLLETKFKNFLENIPKKEIINFMYDSIDPSQKELKGAFKILNDFKLSFRGLIQHRIRKHFHIIYPNTARPITLKNEDEAFISLKSLHDEVLNKCAWSLKNLATEPDLAIFSIVEEFEDRSIRALDKDLDLQWKNFIRKIRAEIWPEEFKRFEDKIREKESWNNCQQKIKKEIENINKIIR